MEIYVDDDELPTIASTIADDIQQGYVEDIDAVILNEAYEMDYNDSYWIGDYDEFAEKLKVLVEEELNQRNETISDN